MNQNRRQHCLVVDDVRPYRELLCRWMTEWGFGCTAVERAREAWDAMQERPIDLIVTDIDMPDINGLQLIRAIRQSESQKQRTIPVIVISSLRDDAIDLITRQVGAVRFIPKPLEKSSFHQALQNVFDGDHHAAAGLASENLDIDIAALSKTVSPRLRRMFYQRSPSPREKLQ